MRYILVFVGLAVLIGCHRGSSDQTAYVRNMTAYMRNMTAYMRNIPLPTPTPVTGFVAVDFQKAGQPKLTAAEISLIRKTINVVKPCQRVLLRYSFDLDDPSRKTIDVYFERGDPADLDSHVLWHGNDWYFFDEGHTGPQSYAGEPMPDWSIRADIANEPCR